MKNKLDVDSGVNSFRDQWPATQVGVLVHFAALLLVAICFLPFLHHRDSEAGRGTVIALFSAAFYLEMKMAARVHLFDLGKLCGGRRKVAVALLALTAFSIADALLDQGFDVFIGVGMGLLVGFFDTWMDKRWDRPEVKKARRAGGEEVD